MATISIGVGALAGWNFGASASAQDAALDLDLRRARLGLVQDAARRVVVDLGQLVAIDGEREAAVILEAARIE